MSRSDDNDKHRQIWQVTTKMPVGQLQAYRSTKIGDAIRLDKEDGMVQVAVVGETNPTKKHTHQKTGKQIANGTLAIWMTLQLSTKDLRPRFIPGRQKGFGFDAWALITSFAIGDNHPDIFSSLNTVVNYALITRGLFKVDFHPDVLVQAVLHGDATMVRHILTTNPDLSKIGTAIDFSGREFTGTALQAAVASTDFAPNKNSTGLCELIVEKLKEQYPDHWHEIFHAQTLELYTKSLRFYAEKQADKIRALTEKKENGEVIDEAALEAAKQRHQTYLEALHSNDLKTIIEAHTNPDPDPAKAADAQKDHVFQIDQALIDAIAIASDTEIQAILDDPTIDSLLSHLLKQFRSDFTTLSHEEMIFNPQHLLKIFTLYDAFYDRVAAVDPHLKKRELFWCHLVGFVQRYSPANVAQIFANPGLYATVEGNEKNCRTFDFKYSGGSIFPLSFDPHSNLGLGYKFAGLGRVVVWQREGGPRRVARYKTYVEQKQQAFKKLIALRAQACAHKSERRCIVM